MYLISHRGNTQGPLPEKENQPLYIRETLALGFDVEIDVWYVDNLFYLGHDSPDYPVTVSFLKQDKLWLHAKNHAALIKLLDLGLHVFSHNIDDVVLTSRGIPWAYPGKPIYKSICVMPELANYTTEELKSSLGICSDFIVKFLSI